MTAFGSKFSHVSTVLALLRHEICPMVFQREPGTCTRALTRLRAALLHPHSLQPSGTHAACPAAGKHWSQVSGPHGDTALPPGAQPLLGHRGSRGRLVRGRQCFEQRLIFEQSSGEGKPSLHKDRGICRLVLQETFVHVALDENNGCGDPSLTILCPFYLLEPPSSLHDSQYPFSLPP